MDYENAAECKTVKGWECKTCGKLYVNGTSDVGKTEEAEHIARWCCCDTRPCSCGGRIPKGHSACPVCEQKEQTERWLLKPEAPWNGHPLYSHTLFC